MSVDVLLTLAYTKNIWESELHFEGFEPEVHLRDNFIVLHNIDDGVKSLKNKGYPVPTLVIQMSKL